MKKIILALALSGITFGAMADFGDEGLKYRIDQDAVNYIDTNMMWSNNCEYQLNARVARDNANTDGKIASDDDWRDILETLCDHSMGFSTMF